MAKQEKSAAELYREERKERLAKAAKKNAKQHHKIIWTKKNKSVVSIIVVLALVLGITGIVLNSLGVLERGKKIMNVGEQEVDKYEMVYYASRIYQNLAEQSYQYDSYYGEGYGVMFTGIDWSVQPAKQEYSGVVDGVENPTVADYILSLAKEELQRIKAYVAYAEDNGITLDSTELAEVQTNINDMKTTAQNYGYGYANYLRSEYGYGSGMTPDLYEKIITEITLADKVQTLKNDEYVTYYDGLDEDEIEALYNENITKFGVVSFRSYTVKYTDSDEADAAKTTAETLAEKKDSESFISYVSELEKALENEKYEDYLTDDTLTLTENAYYSSVSSDDGDDETETEAEKCGNWLFDTERAEGDTYVLENEGTGYTVYMITEPVHKIATEYTYNVRHILLQFEDEQEADETSEETDETSEEIDETAQTEQTETVEPAILDTTKYENVVIDIDVDLETTVDPILYMEAQDILIEYLEGDMTEDAFGELAVTYSSDGNAADGGIYEDVAEGDMVAEFEGWALEEGRQEGDVGIVETEYGYHIMYFIGKDEATSWSSVVCDTLSSEDFSDFEQGVIDAAPISDYKVKYDEDVLEFIKETARLTINNLSYESSYSYY